MAVALDVISTLDPNGGNNPSWSHTCTGSNLLLIVIMARWPASAVSAVTYNGVALTLSVSSGDDGSGDDVDIWYLVNPPTGAHTIAFTGTNIGGRVAGISWTGVDQSVPVGTGVAAIGNSATPTVDVASATNEVVFGVMAADSAAGTPTAGAGQTPPDWATIANFEATAASHEAGASTTTHSYTISSLFWAIAAIPIKPVSPPAPTIPLGIQTISFPHPPMRIS